MDWYLIPNEKTDLVHYGTKGQKWGQRKQKVKVGRISAKTDEQLTSSHKQLGKMKYDDALKYYKSIYSVSPSVLEAWLQKHKIGLNALQYKKYVLNAVKKAQSGADRSNALKNITNRALGKSERYKTESIPEFNNNNNNKTETTSVKKKITTKKKVETAKKEPEYKDYTVERKPRKTPFTLETAIRRNKIKKNIQSRR